VIDAWIDFNTHGVWDYLASALICQEAGALIVEHQDRNLVVHEHSQRRTPIAAATSELLASVRQVRAQQN
jgi:fructose-1,6-bisphosphatase/inositol monophosphatase family enzyme